MPRQYVWVRADEIWPPEFHRLSHASVRKRGSTTTPDWTNHPGWTHKKPLKKWARRCIEKWCLLPPYDTTITEPQWMAYYEERCALDRVNTKGSAEAEPILSEEELVQDTWTILRKSAADVAAAILGSLLDDEERKQQIARTLMGSLYFTSLWGNDEGADEPDPRNVDAKTRLYSPFGLGTSIDFHYDYYFRLRWQIDHERSSLFNAVVRTVKECSAEHPLECAADSNDENKISSSPAAFTLFERSDGFSQVNNELAVTAFEEPLLGCKGWLSPLKMADLLLAAGTVMHYHERDTETPQSFADELYYFPKETKGKVAVRPELAELAKLEAAADEELEEDEEVCIPQRLLLLARQNWR